MQVAFLGLGQMGRAMVARLVASGVPVRTWNRSGGMVEGAEAAPTIEAAVRGADVAITMLSEDSAVRSVTLGEGKLLGSLRSGASHVSMSTISVQLADELASMHLAAGQHFVNAPVFGRPDMAALGKLWILGGGIPADLERLAPLFNVLGQGTIQFPSARQSALAKLCGNFMIAGLIELLAESLALGEKGGIPPQRLLEMLTGTLFNLPVVHGYGGMIVRNEFLPAGFALPLGLKDMRLLLEAGESLRVPLPAAALLRDRFIVALATGREDQDWSGIAGVVRESAGL
jgi:3-hydroxyisobutyrate dehydrogenase-like beta-hydroxyacid dehydrogenase